MALDISLFKQESNERKPEWLGLNDLLSSIYSKKELNISLSNIFSKVVQKF